MNKSPQRNILKSNACNFKMGCLHYWGQSLSKPMDYEFLNVQKSAFETAATNGNSYIYS